MLKVWIIQNSCYFRFHKSEDFTLHAFIVGFDSLFEIVGAIFVCEVSDNGDRLVGFHLGRDFNRVYNYLSVEDFLLDTLVEVVGDGSDKHALCEVGDFGSRDETIELRGDGGRLIVAVDGHRLSLLEDFSEAFGEGLGCFTYDLTAKDISHSVLDNLAFLVAIVASELREVLKAQTDRHLVRASSGNEVVQATEVDGR